MVPSVDNDGSSESLLMEDLMNHFDQNLRPQLVEHYVIPGLSRPISWVSSNAREVFLVGS